MSWLVRYLHCDLAYQLVVYQIAGILFLYNIALIPGLL